MIRAQIETEMKKLFFILALSATVVSCGRNKSLTVSQPVPNVVTTTTQVITPPTPTPKPATPRPEPRTNIIKTYEYQESSARNLEPEQTMLVSPLIADLKVSETKIYHVEREAFADVVIDASVINDISEYKKIALSRAARANNADVMVGTIMDIVTENGKLVITVSGYPARYTNFRVATTDDTELVREAQMFKNNLNEVVVSTPDMK